MFVIMEDATRPSLTYALAFLTPDILSVNCHSHPVLPVIGGFILVNGGISARSRHASKRKDKAG